MAGQALGRFALQRLGQDTQDTQDSQDCACLVPRTWNRPNGTMALRASNFLARKPFTGAQAYLATVMGVLGVLGVLAAHQKMKSLAGGPPTPSGTPYGPPPLTGNAAILAAHGKARASGWKCRRLEGGCPSQGCAQGVDWERRHLGGPCLGIAPANVLAIPQT